MSQLEHRWEPVFPDAGATDVTSQMQSATLSTGARILIVEDDISTSAVMYRLLSRLGYHVQIADCVASALRQLDESPIDIFLCDIGLPDGSGCDLMAEVRRRGDAVGIAMTGFDDHDDFERSHFAGFSEHLVKPIDFDRLISILAQIRTD